MIKTILNSYIGFVFKRRFIVLSLVAIFATVMIYNVSKLKVDNSLKVWFVDNDPALLSYNSFLDTFGSDGIIITALHDSAAVFTNDRYSSIQKLARQIKNIEGVARTRSIANLGDDNQFSNIPTSSKQSDNIDTALFTKIKQNLHNLKTAKRLISKDGKTCVILVWLDTVPGIPDKTSQIIHNIDSLSQQIVKQTNGSVSLAGVGVVFDALNRATINEGAIFIVLSYVVVLLLTWFFTRRFYWMSVSLISITLSLLTIFGLMSALDFPVNMVSMALPPLIMVIGVANVMHISKHIECVNCSTSAKATYLKTGLIAISIPLLFNALTTAGGFLSLSTANIAITRNYGIFAAIGVVTVFIFSVTISAMLTHFFNPVAVKQKTKTILELTVEKCLILSIKNRKFIIPAAIVIIIIALFFASKINVDTYSIEFLPKNNRARIDSDKIEKTIGNYLPLEFTISLSKANWKSKSFLLALTKFQKIIEQDTAIDMTYSIADILLDTWCTIKSVKDRDISSISQNEILLLGSKIQRHKAVKQLIADKGKTIRLTAMIPMSSAKTLTNVAERIERKANEMLPKYAILKKAGYLPLYMKIINRLLHDQIQSFTIAFIVIILLIYGFLRSWKMVLIAIPSNLLPVIVVLGFMGYASIRLDVATVTIAASVLGIIVDDTVHLLYSFKQNYEQNKSLEEIFSSVASQTGIAITGTSIALCSGFTVVAFSKVSSVSSTGMLTAIAIFVALIADLLLLPAIASLVYRKQ